MQAWLSVHLASVAYESLEGNFRHNFNRKLHCNFFYFRSNCTCNFDEITVKIALPGFRSCWTWIHTRNNISEVCSMHSQLIALSYKIQQNILCQKLTRKSLPMQVKCTDLSVYRYLAQYTEISDWDITFSVLVWTASQLRSPPQDLAMGSYKPLLDNKRTPKSNIENCILGWGLSP